MLPHNINNGKSELHSWQREKKTRKVTELLKDKSVDHGDRQGPAFLVLVISSPVNWYF